MKTVFDKSTRDELITRITALDETSTPRWGKMNVYQMAKHCTQWEEMISGEIICKQSFLGLIFGKMALKNLIKDEKPLAHSTPTSPELKVTDNNGDIGSQKRKWIELLEKNAHSSYAYIIHPFFGKMTRQQVGYLAYKHIDHHLRQFNS